MSDIFTGRMLRVYSGTHSLILSTPEMIVGVCTVQIRRRKDFFGGDPGRWRGYLITGHLEKKIARR